MLIAQISDTHIREPGLLCYDRVDTATYLAKAVARLNSLRPRPDLVLVTGDLVDQPTAVAYSHFRTLLDPLEIPFYLAMGNHDGRENLRKAFTDHAHLGKDGYVQYAIDRFEMRLVVLDTNVPGRCEGLLCRERLDWLEAELSREPHRPTVIAMHHPPFDSGNLSLDRFDLLGRQELAATVERHANIQAILCGHLHRGILTRFGGTVAMTCPSSAHQHHFGLGDSPFGFDLEPPAFLLHAWNGKTLVTHIVLIDRFEGPFLYPRIGSPRPMALES